MLNYMEKVLLNNSQALVYYTVSLDGYDNGSLDVNVTHSLHLTPPLVIVFAILMVFLFSPTIIIGNSLVMISLYRFKRLRTPSNYLVMSLATSDLGIGLFMPVGMYLELCGMHQLIGVRVCLLNYGVAITLCCVSVLVMVAIAVDRFTSLARPLRYNNLITHTAIERYIVVFWVYSALVGFSPFTYYIINEHEFKFFGQDYCSFGNVVGRPIQLFMFCAVYGPSACILLVCYGYIYVVARGHARAISEVRHSLHNGHGAVARYGVALAITTGMFLALWLPFQICMLMDVFLNTNILTDWLSVYLALPILLNSALNPWIYGYRNAELRLAVQKVIDDILTVLGFNYRSHPISEAVAPSVAATAGDPASFINHVKRDYQSLKAADDDDDDFLLVPIAKPESSGMLSDVSDVRVIAGAAKKKRPTMRGSRSMIDSFAIANGTDFWTIKGKSIAIMNGASVV